MSTLIVFCILAIIVIFAYAIYYQISCSKDTDCKTSYKCQSGKCVPPGTATPPGTVAPPPGTPPGSNEIICNSDICTFPYTCKNNQCVSPCSPTNCTPPKVCDGNNNCVEPLCTSDQFATLFPQGLTNWDNAPRAGPCTATSDRKYLSFAKTGITLPRIHSRAPFDPTPIDPADYTGGGSITNDTSPNAVDTCKTKCDLDPNCTIWNYGWGNCVLINRPISGLFQGLGPFEGFEYYPNEYSPLVTNVKASAFP